jgi:hypothetical protein
MQIGPLKWKSRADSQKMVYQNAIHVRYQNNLNFGIEISGETTSQICKDCIGKYRITSHSWDHQVSPTPGTRQNLQRALGWERRAFTLDLKKLARKSTYKKSNRNYSTVRDTKSDHLIHVCAHHIVFPSHIFRHTNFPTELLLANIRKAYSTAVHLDGCARCARCRMQ